ncbi:MAG: FG-GAP repeat protein [Planctomycetes bacterium]|nr:FG-GAP repeat protein [Planctomycetota bacterium]
MNRYRSQRQPSGLGAAPLGRSRALEIVCPRPGPRRLAAWLALCLSVAAGPRLGAQNGPPWPDGESPFPAIVLLDQLEGGITRYRSALEQVGTGSSMASAGDVDGDGWPDLLLGSREENPGRPGFVWVVRGGVALPQQLSLGNLDSKGVLLASGLEQQDRFGSFVAPAGDVDDDGIDDLLIGAPGIQDDLAPRGGVYLLLGSDRLPPALLLAPLVLRGDGEPRAVLLAAGGETVALGTSGSGIGDIDGDGFDDVAVGLPDAGAADHPEGKVLVLFGGPALREGPSVIDLDPLGADRVLEIAGPSPLAELGAAIAPLGDVDGDGFDDFAVGAPGRDEGGAVFIVFGSPALGSLDPPRRLEIGAGDPEVAAELRSALSGARLGASLAGGVDATGDGIPDVAIGAPQASTVEGRLGGLAALVAGGSYLKEEPLRWVDDSLAAIIAGPAGSAAGASVGLVPDLSGDGLGEILIGAPGQDVGLGAAYLVFGGEELQPAIALSGLSLLRPPYGVKILQNQPQARLGEAVVGLPDRAGLGKGAFAVGAPGHPVSAGSGRGVAYEVRALGNAAAPRSLSCSLQSGPRVRLNWVLPRVYRQISVFRDGLPIAAGLPGDLQEFMDPRPPPGLREYFLVADGDEELRSNLCRVDVRPLEVVDLFCFQVPETTRVVVTWRPGDSYGALRILINGEPVLADGSPDPAGLGELLDPRETRFEFDRGPGRFLVEVFDPSTVPEGRRAECEIEVLGREDLPALEIVRCELEDAGGQLRAALRWIQEPAYDAYEIERISSIEDPGPDPLSGPAVRLAVVAGDSFLDEAVPAGRLTYRLRGIRSFLYRGPAAECALAVEPVHPAIQGRVVFDDGDGTAVRRGEVWLVSGSGDPIAGAQVDSSGAFRIPVPDGIAGGSSLRFHSSIDALSEPRGLQMRVEGGGLFGGSGPARVAQDIVIAVPLPLIAVSSGMVREDFWAGLAARLTGEGILITARIPGGVGPGALALESIAERAREHLEDQLGSAPRQVDLLAFGSAGLGARLFAHSRQEPLVRRLVLLGTPNLGTLKAASELRRDLPLRPQAGACGAPHAQTYTASEEQTGEFLEGFNARIGRLPRTEAHVVAGTAGRPELAPLTGCEVHDGRICEESALGGVPGAARHRVGERHGDLGRGASSISLLVDSIGLGRAGENEALPLEVEEKDLEAAALADGGGADLDGSYSTTQTYYGVLPPGDEAELPLLTDTSGSIIIILNTEQPGGLVFSVRTPSGQEVTPTVAAGDPDIEYLSDADGEGNIFQAYHFRSGDAGLYSALILNPPGNVSLAYSLQMVVEGDILLEAQVDPPQILPGETARIEATLLRQGAPIPDAVVEAEIYRPDGTLEVLSLVDDGTAGDGLPGDGLFAAEIPPSEIPGLHLAELTATDAAQATFLRSALVQFAVLSDAAVLGDAWSSEIVDGDGGFPEGLRVAGTVTSFEPGTFLVVGYLSDQEGALIFSASSLLSLQAPVTDLAVSFLFDGETIYLSRIDGPYVVSLVELIDVGAGFVLADSAENVHETGAISWRAFGPPVDAAFVRGDANGDGAIDISDPISVLISLFASGKVPECLDAADSNDDDAIDLSDGVFLLNYLFAFGLPPPPPFPECGWDGSLGCELYLHCP